MLPATLDSSAASNARRRTSVLRVALVGTGLMGRWPAFAAQRAGGRLVALIDVDQHSARSFAVRHPGLPVYMELDQMLLGDTPDVVHICSPLSTHYPLAELA